MKRLWKILALLAAALGGYAVFHYLAGNGIEAEFWSDELSNTLMGYAVLLVYAVTLGAASVYNYRGEKAAESAPRESKEKRDRAVEICFFGCFIVLVMLAIWFNNYVDFGSVGGSYAYYVNGVRASSGSMIVGLSLVAVLIGGAICAMLTVFISRIPAFPVVRKRQRQTSLANTATNAQDKNERMAALRGLYDQKRLSEVARNTRDKEVSLEAVGKLSDQEALSEVAIYARDNDVAVKAFGGLSDQKCLSRVATYGQNKEVKAEAFNKLCGQEGLAFIVQHSNDEALRKKALDKVSDPEWLLAIIKNGRDTAMNLEAVKKISDQKWLCDVAKHAFQRVVCEEAIRKISDRKLLSDIAEGAGSIDVSKIAAAKLDKLTKKPS